MAHTILIVDDEEPIREALRRALQREPYQLIGVGSAAEALDLLGSRQVDVVLSDQNMPGMTGLDLFRRVRDTWPHTIRVLVTGLGDMRRVRQAVDEDAIYSFIQKPWDIGELLLLLARGVRHLDVVRENERLLALVQAQRRIITELEGKAAG